MKTEIVIIIKKPGRQPKVHLLQTVKTRHLEDFRREFTRVIAQTRANRRELKKYQKKRSLRYFLRNLRQAVRCRINAACDMIVGTPSAAEIEYIGIEDGR